jgi:hypothetical protein
MYPQEQTSPYLDSAIKVHDIFIREPDAPDDTNVPIRERAS